MSKLTSRISNNAVNEEDVLFTLLACIGASLEIKREDWAKEISKCYSKIKSKQN